MAIQSRTEFASALNQVCSERGIEPEVVLDSIKQAIIAAYRKDYGELEDIEVDLDSNSGEVKLSHEGKDITPAGFGRIAAQTAKQVILQRIREAEKDAILSEYSSKVESLVSGVVQRISGPVVTVSLGKAEAIMPPQEQAHNEKYYVNQRLKFFLVGIKEGTRGEEIIVSRSANGLLENLFKQEVPEVSSGAVEVKAIAREAGSRSKIAVWSGQLGVDPVGSCVGQKGVRVQAVINELGDEKIDVIAFQEDLGEFIKAALAPAKDLQVKIDEKEKTAEVTAPDDQLSLAIGREGQNVRLAAKLTGYRIDIRGKSGTPKEVEAKEKEAIEKAKQALGVTDDDKKPEEKPKAKEAGTKEAKPQDQSAKAPADDQVQPQDKTDEEPLIADEEEKKEESEAEEVAEKIEEKPEVTETPDKPEEEKAEEPAEEKPAEEAGPADASESADAAETSESTDSSDGKSE